MRSIYTPDVFSIPSLNRKNREIQTQMPTGNPVHQLIQPLIDQAADGCALRYSPVGEFHFAEKPYSLPRFVLRGQKGGGDPLRIGIFAAIHGDEPETALALRDFLLWLAVDPARAQGYDVYAYPVCNPTGFEDGTRHSRAGQDLNREFWRGSRQPEVYYLERELGVIQFHGVISLHADDTVDGTYAYARGATLTDALVEPALAAAEKFLPRANGEVIDGFPARNGVIKACYEGVLSDPSELRPAPFEIIFETPQKASANLQISATVAALKSILREYRQLIAYGQDL
jgi:protein MpaA